MRTFDPFHSYPDHWTDSDFRTLMSLLISVARADGIQDAELNLIKAVASAMQWTETDLQRVLDSTDTSIPPHLAKDGAYILRDLYYLALADDQIHDKERQTINTIADGLGLTKEQQENLEEAVAHRLMSDQLWKKTISNN